MGFVHFKLFLFYNCILLLLLLCFFINLPFAAPTTPEYKYKFIRRASTYSASSSHLRYDYIVVGGGTAGCPLAATLSQNFRVLVLERGGVPFNNYNVSHMQNFHLSLADTSATSASQCFVSTDGVFNSRARVLGGGTCINAGFYSRASSRYVKRAGWDAKLVNECYQWVEKQIVFKPKVTRWQRAVRDALLDVGVSPNNGFTYDHKYGTKIGGTIFDDDGHRHTAAELLGSSNPEKIDVFVYATAVKIVFDAGGQKKPKATGVIFRDENGKKHTAFLSTNKGSEIIVSSGAIGTPQLLILSGIGPKNDLEKMNISVVRRNKFVGKGIQDNPMNTIFIPTKKPIKQSLIQTVGITRRGVYVEASSGFGQSKDSIMRHHGLASAEIGQLTTIPPKQRTPEAIRAYRQEKQNLPFEAFRGGFFLEKLSKPRSIGYLKLTTTDININPSVTFNYFSHPDDLRRCVRGIRMMEEMIRSKHFASFAPVDKETSVKLLNMSVRANVNLIPKHTNDTQSLEQFCRDTVVTIWHYHGGCHVSKVVGPDYRVLGVGSLRVVDGSTFVDSPGTNPQATVMMMGRYMGVKISRERLGQEANV